MPFEALSAQQGASDSSGQLLHGWSIGGQLQGSADRKGHQGEHGGSAASRFPMLHESWLLSKGRRHPGAGAYAGLNKPTIAERENTPVIRGALLRLRGTAAIEICRGDGPLALGSRCRGGGRRGRGRRRGREQDRACGVVDLLRLLVCGAGEEGVGVSNTHGQRQQALRTEKQ